MSFHLHSLSQLWLAFFLIETSKIQTKEAKRLPFFSEFIQIQYVKLNMLFYL